MFSLIRLIIWLTGFIVISHFVLGYFGYRINLEYFKQSKDTCQQEILQCQKDLVKNGVEGVKENCRIECIDPKLIIKEER